MELSREWDRLIGGFDLLWETDGRKGFAGREGLVMRFHGFLVALIGERNG